MTVHKREVDTMYPTCLCPKLVINGIQQSVPVRASHANITEHALMPKMTSLVQRVGHVVVRTLPVSVPRTSGVMSAKQVSGYS